MLLNYIFFPLFNKWLQKNKNIVSIILYLNLLPLILGQHSLKADDLFDLQKKIKQQQQENQHNQQQLNKINIELGEIKLQQSQITINIRNLEQQIQENLKQLNILEQQKNTKRQQIKQNQQALEQLLKFIYKNYNDNNFFNQFINLDSDPKTQFITYFKYLNEQIAKNLTQIKNESNKLNIVINEIKNKQQNLNEKQHKQQQQQSQLIELKSQNINLTKNLENLLNQGNIKLESLINNERLLNDKIKNVKLLENIQKKNKEKQQQSIKNIKFNGLNTNTSYNKPLKNANILHNFGDLQIGEIYYKGIIYKAQKEQKVYAIESGRVVLSSWINGYGLVILIDHGNDYLSLYGYNQTILVKLNQLVNKGQAIAEVGNSGFSDNENTLYFEIRHRGIAKNPNNWIKN